MSEDGLDLRTRRIRTLENYRARFAVFPQRCYFCGYEWKSKLEHPRHCARCGRVIEVLPLIDYRTARID